MTDARYSTSVVVVGAGPVGLTAAALLTAAGVDVLVVERRVGTSDEPKAISLDDESLRTLKLAGLGEELDRIVVPGTGTQYHGADGQPLFRTRMARPLRFGHPFKNPFAQPALEAVLATAVAGRQEATVRFATELRSLTQDGHGVQASLHDLATGDDWSADAQFVLACDGGRSTVRELQSIGMTGRNYAQPWLVVDVRGDESRERFGLHFGDPRRPTVVVPGASGRCRYEFRLAPGEGTPGQAPGHELIERLLAPYRPIAREQVDRAVIYRFNALVADHWRAGRILLAGDAAHMMPPFAGQGLNSGLRDVANVCWKLTGVLDDTLTDRVLDTYEAERRPNAEATVRLSEWLGRVAFTTSRVRASLRDRAVRAALRSGRGRRYLEEMRYRPHARLAAGLLLGGSDRVGTQLEQPRAFDVGAYRQVLLDEVLGTGWSLLGVDVTPDAWAGCDLPAFGRLSPRRVDVGLDDRAPVPGAGRQAINDLDGRVQEQFAPARGRFLLVRPDRVVAAEFLPADTGAMADALAAWQPPADAEPLSFATQTPLLTGVL